VLDRVVRQAARPESELRPRFEASRDIKTMLKIDYKIDRDGLLVVVDVNAGLVGAWFDDLLLDAAPGIADGLPRITPRLARAVLDRYRLQHGRAPRSVALCVLDEEMYEQWADADIAGLNAELRRQLESGPGSDEDVVVIDAAALQAVAKGETPSLLAGEWRGPPDLLLFYSCRIAPSVGPAVLSALEDAGVTLVDDLAHALAAGKELATPETLGDGLPSGVRLPETFVLGAADDGGDAVTVVRGAWRTAAERGWGLLAVKIDKQRRAAGAGDFPSAYLYPVTPLGLELVERQVERTFDVVTAAAGRSSRLVVTHVDHLGGCRDPLGRRDVELRSYAFPQVRVPDSG
jgi:hypothetical protein